MSDPVVTTTQGEVRGRDEGGIAVFRGIPYAAPPVGERRFRPPVPLAPFDDVFDAGAFGPIAIQPSAGPGSYVPGDPIAQDEACLSLNVWSPEPGGSRPVMVFVHGGAFLTGSGASVMYRGDRLAARGAVVVTFNYRLGILGFLAHPLLTDEATRAFGNWGLMDQIAALSYVQANIAAFGGDPANVTVFGESAGAMSIADLLGAPGATGLFKRAILESGAATALPAAPATAIAERVFALLGLEAPTREALETVPPAELLAAQREVTSAVDRGMGMPFRPVVDGAFLPRPPEDEIAAGAAREVELVIGTNRDEFKFFAYAGGVQNLDDPGVAAYLNGYLRGAGLSEDAVVGEEIVVAYRAARVARGEPDSAFEILCAAAGDFIFRLPALRLAEAHARRGGSVRVYRFDWESPFAHGALGACHGIELPFVFGTVRNPVVAVFAGQGDAALELADAIQASWVAFAERGDPSLPDGPAWPRYSGDRRATMIFDRERRVLEAPSEEERRFWDERLGRYGRGGPIEGAVPTGVEILAHHDL